VPDLHSVARAGSRSSKRPSARPKPCIWAVGGGKGGVGKSVITSSLAVTLAGRGQRCVLVAADLGGANLHTILGGPRSPYTISHFLKREVEHLSDVMSPTNTPNLWLASGARSAPDIANLGHTQKRKLLRHIRSLEIEHVFLDLSAGSAYNALDFFLAADHPILAVVPEPTSVENAYHFLKAAFFRALRQAARRSSIRAAIEQVLEERTKRRIRSPRNLVMEVARIDPHAGRLLEEAAQSFSPMLIVNQARTPDHRSLGHQIDAACRSYLGTGIRYLGALSRDDHVNDAVSRCSPVLRLHPGCSFALDLEVIVDRLLSRGTREPRAAVEKVIPLHRHQSSLYDEGYFLTHGAEERARSSPEPHRSAYRRLFEGAWLATADAKRTRRQTAPAPGISRPGAHLRHRREQLGLDLSELCQRTRIRSLESIENERFADLPPEPYVRGFVLQYSKALGLSEGEALAASYVELYRRAMRQSCG
jgi:flagellar biosynthesis protein FlhG